MAELRGTCMCGAISWAYSGPVTRSLVCHCSDCQKATSSPFTAFVGLRAPLLSWTGAPNHFESSPGTHRGFCPTCGTRLYFRSDKWPDEIHMHAATLEDPAVYEPTAQVVMRSKVPWLKELENIPHFQSFEAPPKEQN